MKASSGALGRRFTWRKVSQHAARTLNARDQDRRLYFFWQWPRMSKTSTTKRTAFKRTIMSLKRSMVLFPATYRLYPSRKFTATQISLHGSRYTTAYMSTELNVWWVTSIEIFSRYPNVLTIRRRPPATVCLGGRGKLPFGSFYTKTQFETVRG